MLAEHTLLVRYPVEPFHFNNAHPVDHLDCLEIRACKTRDRR